MPEIPSQTSLDSSKEIVAFIVSDTGTGIPEEKHHVIFEAFQQADGTTSRKYGGTGLGLSISRKIAHMLGGEIYLESQPNKGSIFTLYLPLNYTSTDNRRVKLIPRENKGFKEKPIDGSSLVVHEMLTESESFSDIPAYLHDSKTIVINYCNDPSYSHLLEEVADEQGFSSFVINKAYRVLPLAKELKPAAILLDIDLVDGNGLVV